MLEVGLFSSDPTIGWNAVALMSLLRTLSMYAYLLGKLFYVNLPLGEFLVVLGR